MPAGASLRISADLGNLEAVRRFIRETAPGLQQDQDALEAAIRAVDEAVTNIIVHGYHGQPGSIVIELEQAESFLLIRLLDQAAPFDPTAVPPPDVTSPLEQRPPGGLGIHLIRQMVDELIYCPGPDGGNELRLVKRIGQPHAGES